METLAPHIDRFMAGRVAVGIYGPKSVRVVGPRLRSLSHHFGARPLHHLTRRAIEAWLGNLDHLAINSRAAYLGSVRQFTAWLTTERLLRDDPCVSIPRIRRPRSVPRAQAANVVGAVLDACPTDRERAIVWLMVGMGLRRMEVAALTWDDYDASAGTLVIHGKGGHERVLPVPAEVAAALARVRQRHTGPIITARNRPLVPLSAERIGQLASRVMWAAGVKAAPYDGVSGHALRHTAASDVLDACGDLRVVQQMLGHQQLATTAIYLRRASAEQIRSAMEGRRYDVA